MPNTLKTIVKKSLYISGYYHLYRRLAPPSDRRLLILMYHDLGVHGAQPTDGSLDDDSPSPSQFEAHLRTLAKRCRVISLKNVIASIRCGNALDADSVAITFDDGYESFYSVAYPLLRKYDLPATVFLATDWVGNDMLSWWHRLRQILKRTDLSKIKNEQLRLVAGPDTPVVPPSGKWHSVRRDQFRRRLEITFRNMPSDIRAERLGAFENMLFPDGGFTPIPVKMLSWDKIREMTDYRIDFESHTRTHANIRFAEPSAVEKEIRESKTEIEAKIQREVTGFAYPYGQDLASYVEFEPFLRSLGFAYACNARLGSNSARSNLFSLYRAPLPLTESPAVIHREIILRSMRNNQD